MRRHGWLTALCAAAVVLVFLPCLRNGFVFWDDPIHVVDNPHIRSLGWGSLRWMFSNVDMGQYVPLAWISLALDYRVWGLDPIGYHLTNILWHAAAAAVWFGFWRRLFELARPEASPLDVELAAVFAALAFALHPLRVEPVAWVSERRELLCGFFYALALLFYLDERILAALACHALSLLCKASSMTLPVTLLILDTYPLRRLSRRAFIQKLPFFALSADAMAVTAFGLHRFGVLAGLAQQTSLQRLARACYGLLFYAAKTAWPSALRPIYEQPNPFEPLTPRFLLCMAVVPVAAALLWRLARRRPVVGAASAHYAAAILPVSGLVANGIPHLALDRYSYLAGLAFSALLGAGLLELLAGRRRAWGLAAAAALLLVWGTLSFRQCRVWRDDLSLWSAAVAAEPGPIALRNLAAALGARGEFAASAVASGRAIILDPREPANRRNLAAALYGLSLSRR